jgi:hypothetical protein
MRAAEPLATRDTMNRRRLVLFLSLSLLVAACGRTASVGGQVQVEGTPAPGKEMPRATVWLIPASDIFEGEWRSFVAALREALQPALERQRAAEHVAAQARRTWDRAVAVQGASGVGLSQWNRSTAGRHAERQLWSQVQRTSVAAFEARQRVLQTLARQSDQARDMLRRYASQEVVSNADGGYIVTKVRPGKAYLYASLRLPDRELTWFRLIEVRPGMQQVDLAERQVGGWPFAPGL